MLAFVGSWFSAPAHAKAAEIGCPAGMTCRTVTVPLDWTGKQPGRLKLDVRVTRGSGPLLLNLSGGPGQAGTPYVVAERDTFAARAPNYRLAVFDQRGTGATAVRCPRLQRLALTDVTVRPRKAVQACGESLGRRRGLYATTSTVYDIEALRKALGVKRMAIMGTSYGTYVAIRYARAFPHRVSRLILDSVVPQEGPDPMLRVHMRRVAKVLRWECGGRKCGFASDPAADLAQLVAMRPYRGRVPGAAQSLKVDGPALLDRTTMILSFLPKEIPRLARGIHRAVRGDFRTLLKVAQKARQVMGPGPAETFSWGLHAATLCTDMALPFPIDRGNRRSRIRATARYLSRLPKRRFWPFDMATALGNGLLQTCAGWPRTEVAPPPKPGKITQPALLLAGQYDISTPVEYARRELRRAPRGRLVVVPRVGHGAALQHRCAVRAISSFLKGNLGRDPCRSR